MKKTKISLKRSSKLENELFSLMQELFPICRSITGNGVRKTLKILKKEIDLKIVNVPSEPRFLIGKYLMNGTLKMHM